VTHLGDLTGGLIDGELCGGAHGNAVAHLAECAQCRREVSLHRHVKSLLSTAAIQGEPGDDLLAKLLQIPQYEPFPAQSAHRGSRLPGVRWHAPRGVAAAGFAASVVVGLGGAVTVSGALSASSTAASPTPAASTSAAPSGAASVSFVPATFVPTGPVGGPLIRHGERVAATVVYRRP
jgi:anti-sigma factor RsiW